MMTEKTFLEKNPEFKRKEHYVIDFQIGKRNKEIIQTKTGEIENELAQDPHTMVVKTKNIVGESNKLYNLEDVEEILDKHFVKKDPRLEAIG